MSDSHSSDAHRSNLHQVRILRQSRINDRDAYCSICAYDETDTEISVIVTGQAIKDLERFDCSLNEIVELAVEDALERGQTNGEVLVTTTTPTFQHLTARFRKTK